MLKLLLFENIFFATSIFSFLVFFACFWLQIDAVKQSSDKKNIYLKAFGFLSLAISFLMRAFSLEVIFIDIAIQSSKIIGLFLIFLSLFNSPTLSIGGAENKKLKTIAVPIIFASALFEFSSALLLLAILVNYSIKTGRGMQKQEKPAVLAFLLLFLAEIGNGLLLFSDTSMLVWSRLLADYSFVWDLTRFFEFSSALVFFFWMFGYMRFRLKHEIFIINIFYLLIIFISSTLIFSYMLVNNFKKDVLSHLRTDVKILQYSLEKQEADLLNNVSLIAKDQELKTALADNNKDELKKIMTGFLLDEEANYLELINSDGSSLVKAESQDLGDDTSNDDSLIVEALNNKEMASITTSNYGILPRVQISTAVPVTNDKGELIALIHAGVLVDNAFVDGIQKVTGLDTSVYAGDSRSATTLISEDGMKFVGTKESDEKVLSSVLGEGNPFYGETKINNQDYFAAFEPIKNYKQENIGMLSVAKHQVEAYETFKESTRYTFFGASLLLLVSLLPTYLVSKYIEENANA